MKDKSEGMCRPRKSGARWESRWSEQPDLSSHAEGSRHTGEQIECASTCVECTEVVVPTKGMSLMRAVAKPHTQSRAASEEIVEGGDMLLKNIIAGMDVNAWAACAAPAPMVTPAMHLRHLQRGPVNAFRPTSTTFRTLQMPMIMGRPTCTPATAVAKRLYVSMPMRLSTKNTEGEGVASGIEDDS